MVVADEGVYLRDLEAASLVLYAWYTQAEGSCATLMKSELLELQRTQLTLMKSRSRHIHAGERQWKPHVQAHVSVGGNALQHELHNNITFFK